MQPTRIPADWHIRPAILTRVHAATERLGTRISATTVSGRRVTIAYPHDARPGADAHNRAIIALRQRYPDIAPGLPAIPSAWTGGDYLWTFDPR